MPDLIDLGDPLFLFRRISQDCFNLILQILYRIADIDQRFLKLCVRFLPCLKLAICMGQILVQLPTLNGVALVNVDDTDDGEHPLRLQYPLPSHRSSG